MEDKIYQSYLEILQEELVPALGCTEPIALAYAAAGAREVFGIQAVAIAFDVTLYFAASLSSALLRAGNFSFPINTPSNIPYWKGDQACSLIFFRRQYSITLPSPDHRRKRECRAHPGDLQSR